MKGKEAFCVLLIGITIAAGHLNALFSFGATFWIDSLGYMPIGDVLFDPAKLRSYYDGVGSWAFSHVGPGLPFFWWGLQLLPATWQWPACTACQHLLAALACWLAFTWAVRPSFVGVFFSLLLNALPFYQSGLQMMLMTESFASSFLLLAIACALRLTSRSWKEPLFWILLAALFLVTQVRSYFAFMVFGLAAVTLISGARWRSWRTPLLVGMLGVAALAFPGYRFLLTGQFFLPAFGTNSLYWALRANPAPSENLLPVLAAAELPPDLPAVKVLSSGLSYVETHAIGQHWRACGYTDAEIKTRAERLANAVFHDGSAPSINRAFYGLISSGFLLPLRLLPADYQVTRGMNGWNEQDFQNASYRWLSWLDTAQSYSHAFTFFFETPQLHLPDASVEQMKMIAALRPYFRPEPAPARDPLRLGRWPIDCWSLGGLIGLLLLCGRREFWITTLLAVPIVVNLVMMTAAAAPNVRYAYTLVPIFFLAAACGGSALLRVNRRKAPVSSAHPPGLSR